MPTKKKTTVSKKKTDKEYEKKIKALEKNIEIMLKIKDEEEKNEKRKETVNDKAETIKEDLKNQLIVQNKFGKQFDDMIEDYIFFVKLKEDLQYDIKEKGIRYATMTGNGYMADKPNESVPNLLKVNGQMLKILQDLDLKAPDEEGGGDDLLQ